MCPATCGICSMLTTTAPTAVNGADTNEQSTNSQKVSTRSIMWPVLATVLLLCVVVIMYSAHQRRALAKRIEQLGVEGDLFDGVIAEDDDLHQLLANRLLSESTFFDVTTLHSPALPFSSSRVAAPRLSREELSRVVVDRLSGVSSAPANMNDPIQAREIELILSRLISSHTNDNESEDGEPRAHHPQRTLLQSRRSEPTTVPLASEKHKRARRPLSNVGGPSKKADAARQQTTLADRTALAQRAIVENNRICQSTSPEYCSATMPKEDDDEPVYALASSLGFDEVTVASVCENSGGCGEPTAIDDITYPQPWDDHPQTMHGSSALGTNRGQEEYFDTLDDDEPVYALASSLGFDEVTVASFCENSDGCGEPTAIDDRTYPQPWGDHPQTMHGKRDLGSNRGQEEYIDTCDSPGSLHSDVLNTEAPPPYS
jgi:hypothetical protein